MARSNNQRRRTMKSKGLAFVPAWTKSKTRRRANDQKVKASTSKGKKLAYNKVIGKDGKVKQRKFRPGGYNNSGKLGSARASKKGSGGAAKKQAKRAAQKN